MNFKRMLVFKDPIELTQTSEIDLGLVFKQYDLGTSTLVLDTLFNGEPCNFSTESVYITYKTPTTKYRDYIPLTREEDGSPIVDQGRVSQSKPGRLYIDLDEEVLTNSGLILGELLIVDESGTKRFTSPTIKFTVKESLTENTRVRAGMVLAGFATPNQMVPNITNEGEKTEKRENITSFLSKEFLDKYE